MALKLNCLEPLTAIGIGVGACALAPLDAGLTAAAVIGGAGLFARIRENIRKAGLDDDALVARMQKTILREWDDWQATAEKRDAVTEADAAMTRFLPQVMLTREELAATVTETADERYPVFAARKVVDRLALHDAMFAEPADGVEPSLHRRFALAVIERALRTAKDDKDYATFLTLDIAIELGRAIAETTRAIESLGAKIDAGFAAVQQALGGEFEKVSVQALRGAVSRFVAFRPQATVGEVVDAVERFVPDYEALRDRVSALDAADNRVKGAQQAAAVALEEGDLDAARRHLAEAADVKVDRAVEAVREAAATIEELARADLLALDWQSADANWARASALLAPFDQAAADMIEDGAASALLSHGETFAQSRAIDAAIRRWKALTVSGDVARPPVVCANLNNSLGTALQTLAAHTGGPAGIASLASAIIAYRDALTVCTESAMPVQWAMIRNNLGIALAQQGERTGGEAGVALLADAVTAYRSALTVHTEVAMPEEWASVQNNLGTALRTQGERIADVGACAVERRRHGLSCRTYRSHRNGKARRLGDDDE